MKSNLIQTIPKTEPSIFSNLSSTNFVSNTIPIAAIPGGSGNGYATTVCGVHDAASTAIAVALGKVLYTDVIATAELEENSVMVNFKIHLKFF